MTMREFYKSALIRITCVSVTVANGIKSYTHRTLVNFALKLGDFNDKITSSYVFPVNSETNYGLLLDLPWLFKNNPHIDWKTGIITITINHQKYLLETKNSYKKIIKDKFVDTIECDDHFLINAKEISKSLSIDKQVNQFLKEFSDIFSDDLIELPPKRNIDHEIKIFDDIISPSQQPFRMSQPELAELIPLATVT
ncbi:unnamed protein product, partial [Rotaria sordida]